MAPKAVRDSRWGRLAIRLLRRAGLRRLNSRSVIRFWNRIKAKALRVQLTLAFLTSAYFTLAYLTSAYYLIRPASHPQFLKMPPRARFRYIILLNLAPEPFELGGGGWGRHGPYFRNRTLAEKGLTFALALDPNRVLGGQIRKVVVFRAGLDDEEGGGCFQLE